MKEIKEIDYHSPLILDVLANRYLLANYANNDLHKLQEKKPTELTFIRLLSDYLYNEIIVANENYIKDSLPNNLEKLLFMRDIFKLYDENFSVNLGNIMSETGKIVKRLNHVVNSVKHYKKVDKKEIESLRELCKRIESRDEARLPPIGPALSVHCPYPGYHRFAA